MRNFAANEIRPQARACDETRQLPEKLLSQADVFTPPAPNSPPPAAINQNTVQFADHVARLGLAVDQHLPLHGRVVPFAELHKAIGRGN